jgi:adenosylmethionine-8-amino-7-oxononanoate aminotransferase
MAEHMTDEPLTHFFHCWRFPDHHRCAVALIERQAVENDQLLVRAAQAERTLRDQWQECAARHLVIRLTRFRVCRVVRTKLTTPGDGST